MSFTAGAQRCWRAASLLLNWRPEEFWRATPAELAQSLPAQDAAAVGMSVEEFTSLRSLHPDLES
ncbi:phage tail assembly chaperone [Sphingomonas sp. BN140010]|uniref:Phage tail assembly chaperone n=1 Tax=Sphingomonas arvum TaxID=2992113 RepID=A0ABT3JHS0_9SPHN|nr:phage tail assembly chaperone [Sphingomonas sp. BN140010]MCW3798624.1 phage tail assembly chaperone [Sphingomonas sp. BN140010]